MNTHLLTSALHWVVQSSAAACVLAGMVAIVHLALGKRLDARWRFLLWSAVLVRLLMPLAPQSPTSLFNIKRLFESEKAPYTVSVIISENAEEPISSVLAEPPAPERVFSPLPSPLDFAAVASAGWALVAGAMVIRIVLAHGWMHWRLRGSRTNQFDVTLDNALSHLPVAVRPRIYQTPCVEAPCLFGLLRPRLLLPPGIETRLSQSELQHVFLHELGHVRRGDLLWNWAMGLAQALHWFNPVVWLVLKQMRLERELACDALALKRSGPAEAKEYGRTILKLMDSMQTRAAAPSSVGIVEEKQTARARLAQIGTAKPTRVWKLGIPVLVLLAITGLTDAQISESPTLIEPPQPSRVPEAEAEAEPAAHPSSRLHARVYRLDPDTTPERARSLALLENDYADAWTLLPEKPTHTALLKMFESEGVVFKPFSPQRQDEADEIRTQPKFPPPQKALFYNDVTGDLFIRVELADIKRIEEVLQRLNTYRPERPTKTQALWAEGSRLAAEGRNEEAAEKFEEVRQLTGPQPKQTKSFVSISSIISDDAGSVQIRFDVKIVSIKQRAQAKVGFDWLPNSPLVGQEKTNSAATPSTMKGILTEEQARIVFRTLEATEHVDILSTPRISTLSGRAAAISIEGDGAFLKTELTGNIDTNANRTIALRARVQPKEGADAPVHDANLYPKQTLVISAPSDAMPADAKETEKLLFFITPVLIDSTGKEIQLPKRDPDAIPTQAPGFKNAVSIPGEGALPTLRFRETTPTR